MTIETPATLGVVCPHCDARNRVARGRLTDEPRCGACKARVFEARPAELSEAAFWRHVERSDLPLVVDFWAPWCAPCRMMAPAFEGAARDLEPHTRLAKVNLDHAPDLAVRLRIHSVPTLAIFDRGREIARASGAMDQARLVAWARSQLASRQFASEPGEAVHARAPDNR